MVLHSYVLRVQYSCGVVLVFWFWREIVFGVTYVYTHYAWAGGTFFPVVLLCQFFVLVENRFWFFILLMIYLEYHSVVVLC